MQRHTVGQYELGEMVGAGSVGHAYRARHAQTGQPAVIKLLQADLAAEPDVQRRFVREVAIAEKLNHPNVVRHYDCGLHDDRIYFAMELVDSGTLKEVLADRERLPWREAVECGIQVCAALDHAHRLGIIHRDLKPANLFLSADGHVKVGDFGLARDLNNTRLTADGQTVGTCRYMPPEQISGDDELTGAVDLYALGCILHEMIAGEVPFDGTTVVEIFESHLYDEPIPLREIAHSCPPDLEKLVLLLLAKDPRERPVDAGIVEAALADILLSRPMKLDASSAPERPTPAPPSDPKLPNLTVRLQTIPAEELLEPDTHWRMYAALGAIAVVLIAAIVVAVLR